MPLGGFALARNDRRGKRPVAAHTSAPRGQSVVKTPLIRRYAPPSPRGKAFRDAPAAEGNGFLAALGMTAFL